MAILKILGAALVVLWLVLWLALKVASGLIHLLVLVGLAMIIIGFIKRV
jgi:hypothetical protein